MRDYYEMEIAGVKCRLEKYPISDKLEIAAFILFGNVEVTVAASKQLLERAPEFDVILTPEAKSIPLAYEMSRMSGKKYIVARKGRKVYMGDNPLEASVRSITTQSDQRLFLGESDIEQIKGKRVLIVDDVVSTGGSLDTARALCKKAGGTEVATCAVLAEGDAVNRTDLIFLGELPLFERK